MRVGAQIIFVVAAISLLSSCGCSLERTAWNTRGRYFPEISAPDGTPTPSFSPVTLPDEHRHKGRIRLADEQALTIHFTSASRRPGTLASLSVVIGESLNRIGVHEVIGGWVKVYGTSPSGEATTAIRSDEWKIAGTVEIKRFEEIDPPPRRVGQENVVEYLAGVFNLVAENPTGNRVVIRNGEFEIEVHATRYQWDPS